MLQEEQKTKEYFSVKTFRDRLVEHRISLAFHGMFSQDVLTLIGKTLMSTPDSQMLSKRLFAIVIEMAQNILHYSAERVFSEKDGREIGVGIVAICQSDDQVVVSSGNYIQKRELQALQERAAYINTLDEGQLRDFYRDQRKAPQREGKPGANLGLIDMARRSGNPIQVDAFDYSEELAFFILTIRVNKAIA